MANLRDRRGQGTREHVSIIIQWHSLYQSKKHTVFFLARSPEAPRTTMTVLSLSSMALRRLLSAWSPYDCRKTSPDIPSMLPATDNCDRDTSLLGGGAILIVQASPRDRDSMAGSNQLTRQNAAQRPSCRALLSRLGFRWAGKGSRSNRQLSIGQEQKGAQQEVAVVE